MGPALLVLTSHLLGASGAALPFARVWAAHIGFDRLLGYGLKYPTRLVDTHLGLIGRQGR